MGENFRDDGELGQLVLPARITARVQVNEAAVSKSDRIGMEQRLRAGLFSSQSSVS
jgi:hypothetical protein